MDKRLMAEARLARLAFLATVCLSVLGGVLVMAQASLLSHIITRAFLELTPREALFGTFLTLLAVVALRALAQAGMSMSAGSLATHVKTDLRARWMAHVVRLGVGFAAGERTGELAISATKGIETLDGFFRDYLPALFSALLIPLVILIVVLPIDALTFFVLLFTAPLIPLFMVLIGMAAGALARSQYAQLGRMSAHFLDVMQGLSTLKLFNRSQAQLETIGTITEQFRDGTMNVLRVAFLSALALELLATISVAVVAVEVGLRLLYGGIAFEQALFLLIIAPEFYMPLRQLGAKFHTARDSAAAADRLYSVLNTPPKGVSGTRALPVSVYAIRFEDVHYAYDDGKREALRGVSFRVERGAHLAVVGASGSGKSTLASLLMGFIQPTAGDIWLETDEGEVRLRDVDADAWRATLAYVPQRGYLFNASVADNVRIARPSASDEDVQRACEQANAHPFIARLPQGYETVVGENAVRLSGGQAQRLALARAFLRQPALYVLDEATASLDADNEARIVRFLRSRAEGQTLFSIAHRLDVVQDADEIIVLDGGRVIEHGTHSALLQQGGAYYALLTAYGEAVQAE
jgi:ATP-binding cassette subfamily C protein CydD